MTKVWHQRARPLIGCADAASASAIVPASVAKAAMVQKRARMRERCCMDIMTLLAANNPARGETAAR